MPPVTAPHVSPIRAIPAPKLEAIRNAVSRSIPSASAKAEKTDWEHENPSRNLFSAVSAIFPMRLLFISNFYWITLNPAYPECFSHGSIGSSLQLRSCEHAMSVEELFGFHGTRPPLLCIYCQLWRTSAGIIQDGNGFCVKNTDAEKSEIWVPASKRYKFLQESQHKMLTSRIFLDPDSRQICTPGSGRLHSTC